jgi:hypothetical protein
MKSTDSISDIGIDDVGRLYIKPQNEQFVLIYRSATEVHWDSDNRYLYSPKPREWTYLMWYQHIVTVIRTECNCDLRITQETNWYSVSDNLKNEVIDWEANYFSR